MRKSGFTKEKSFITKGILILMLLFHHVFASPPIDVELLFIDDVLLMKLAKWGKLCISGFVFISAYGMTKQMMKLVDMSETVKAVARRLIKLEANCLFIYVFAIIYKRFGALESIRELYTDNYGDFCPIYMLIDGLGLANFFETPILNVTWWYLSFAVLFILSFPALLYMYRKMRWFLFPLVLLFSLDTKIAAAVLGIAFAYEGWFEKLEVYIGKSKKRNVVNLSVSVGLIFLSYRLSLLTPYEVTYAENKRQTTPEMCFRLGSLSLLYQFFCFLQSPNMILKCRYLPYLWISDAVNRHICQHSKGFTVLPLS